MTPSTISRNGSHLQTAQLCSSPCLPVLSSWQSPEFVISEASRPAARQMLCPLYLTTLAMWLRTSSAIAAASRVLGGGPSPDGELADTEFAVARPDRALLSGDPPRHHLAEGGLTGQAYHKCRFPCESVILLAGARAAWAFVYSSLHEHRRCRSVVSLPFCLP